MIQKEHPVDGFKKFEAQVVISRWGEDTTDLGCFKKRAFESRAGGSGSRMLRKGLEVTNCMDLAKDPAVLAYIRAWVLIQDGLGGVALCFSVSGVG